MDIIQSHKLKMFQLMDLKHGKKVIATKFPVNGFMNFKCFKALQCF